MKFSLRSCGSSSHTYDIFEDIFTHSPETTVSNRIAIIIASKGRPSTLAQWRELTDAQTVKPSLIVYSVVDDDDLPDEEQLYDKHMIVKGPAGLTKQRNRGLDAVLDKCDFVAFFDDDYVPASNCVENILTFMRRHPEVAGANGLLLRDGINNAGVSFYDAKAILADFKNAEYSNFAIERDLIGLYGCNMVFRSSAIDGIRFDEKLPLYAWQEDIDFSMQIEKHGRIVQTKSFAGIHQGIKSGRGPGKQLGYSQVANPVYLIRKGTMPFGFGAKLIVKNFLGNHARMLWPESWVDRRGRAVGNWLALRDLITSRLDPERILQL